MRNEPGKTDGAIVLFNTVLFTGNANPALAQEIASHLGIELGAGLIGCFSDGEVRIEVQQNARARDIFVIQPTCAPTNENLMELYPGRCAQARQARRSPRSFPTSGYARQDRRPLDPRADQRQGRRQHAGSVGVERLLTMDLHADQIQGFFDIPVDNIYASPVLLSDLKKQELPEPGGVSPDVGGVVARALASSLAATCHHRQAPPNPTNPR